MAGKAYGSDSGGSPYRSSSFAVQIIESVSCLSLLFLFSGTNAFPLKQIYQKQPISRQPDLVRLVLSITEFG